MSHEPLVSIIVNNHNYGDYLAEAIDSALAQTHQPLEVVVVDDGSTDHSREIIRSYEDRIVPILKPNGGQGSALNAGFAASRGEIVIFLDADDLLLPTAAERAVPLLGEQGVVKVHWPLSEIDREGRPLGRVQPPRDLEDGDFRDKIAAEGPLACQTQPTSGNAWARSFLNRILPMPEREFSINSDGYLVTLAWIYGAVRAVREPQGMYRVHGQNRYAYRPHEEQLRRQREMFAHRSQVLVRHLQALGLSAEPGSWKAPGARYEAAYRIVELAPPGTRFLLVDGGLWADDEGGCSMEGAGDAVPFLEKGGIFWGFPEDDGEAIRELERERLEGADLIVFAWCSWWWLERYPAFAAHLESRYRRVRSDDLLIAYDLRAATGTS